MKEFTIKLVSHRLADLRDSHKRKENSLRTYSSYITKLTAELEVLRKEIADLEADLQASNITFTEIAQRTAFELLQRERDHVVKSFAVPADILKGAPQKKTDHVVAEWSHHAGGPRPVEGQKKISVILRNGAELTGLAERYDWSHNKALPHADVILWREAG